MILIVDYFMHVPISITCFYTAVDTTVTETAATCTFYKLYNQF